MNSHRTVLVCKVEGDEGENLSFHLAELPPEGESSLEFLRDTLECNTVDVASDGYVDLWFSDDPEVMTAPVNHYASQGTGRPIRGHVVLAGCDAEGNTVGAPQDLIDHFREVAMIAEILPMIREKMLDVAGAELVTEVESFLMEGEGK